MKDQYHNRYSPGGKPAVVITAREHQLVCPYCLKEYISPSWNAASCPASACKAAQKAAVHARQVRLAKLRRDNNAAV